jgi:integrase
VEILSQSDVEKAPAGYKLHRAGRNLFLQVRSGKHGGTTRSWLFVYKDRTTGKTRQKGLGSTELVTLTMAREKARDQHAILEKGEGDPIEVGKRQRRQRKADAQRLKGPNGKTLTTVNDFCGLYYKESIAGKSKQYDKTMVRQLDRVGHALGPYPVRDVNSEMIAITSGLKSMRQKNPPEAKHLTRALFGVFELAEVYCKLPNNQAEAKYIDRYAPINKKHWVKRRASIPYQQMESYLEELFAYEDGSVQNRGHLTTALWLKWVIFSGCRISEARLATWDEPKGNNWIVPWEHLKSGQMGLRRHALVRPITTQMQAVLDVMRDRRRNDTNLIFPNPDGGEYTETSMGRFIRETLEWKIEVENIEPITATAHGTRSTLTSWATAQRESSGIRKYEYRLVDIQLDHIPGDLKDDQGRTRKGAQAYGPTANPLTLDDTIEPRRSMMQAYNDFIWPNGKGD